MLGGAPNGGAPLRQAGQGGKAGGHPEPARGDFRGLCLDGPENTPHPALAHHQVLVRRRSGDPGPPQGGNSGAHERAGREGRPEEVRLLLADRPLGRETGEHPGGRRKRLECGSGGVEGRGRRLTDERTPERVPEVQEGDVLRLRGFGFAGGEQEIVVVGVVVKRAGGERQEVRQSVPDGVDDVSVDAVAVLLTEDFGSRGNHGGRVGRGPGNLLDVELGIVEAGEGALHPPDQPPDGFQQGVRPTPEGGERQALEVAKQTHPVTAPAEVPPSRQPAGGGRNRFREAERRVPLAGPGDEAVLQAEPFGPLGGAADLEDEPLARIVLQQEVGVALAGERGRAHLQSPQRVRGGRCLANRDPWPVPEGVDGEREPPHRRGAHQRSRSRRSPSLPR